MSVIGEVEIYPAGFSDGAVTLDRSTDQLYVGIKSHVISNIAEAAGADSRRVDVVAHSGSQDPTIYHVARRLLRWIKLFDAPYFDAPYNDDSGAVYADEVFRSSLPCPRRRAPRVDFMQALRSEVHHRMEGGYAHGNESELFKSR